MTTSAVLLILPIVLVVAIIGTVIVALTRRSKASAELALLVQTMERLANAQTEQGGRLHQIAETQTVSQGQFTRTLEVRLDSIARRLGDGLSDHARKTGETMSRLHERLGLIDAAQKNIAALSEQVVGLQDILGNKQARGAFGEIQLNDLVSSALPPSAYTFQATLGNGKRADCLLDLPNPPGSIAIDAKFPLESYQALGTAKEEADHARAERAFAADLRKHILDIAERYIVPGETAESALMFLPSEAVYAEIHANFRNVVEESFRRRVWIVSPTTLMATLNTVRAILKDAHMREQAGVIQKELLLLMDDMTRLDDRVEKLQSHFGQTTEDVRKIRISTDKVLRRAERIEEVQLGEDEPSANAVPAQPKIELVGD